MREQFLVELGVPGAARAIDGLTGLNELFAAWVETVYHQRTHSETGQPPLERFLAAGPPDLPTPAQLHEAFLWSQRRTVTKTATVSLHGNVYEVDAALVGRRVEVVFDPFDLTTLDVRYQGRSMGTAIPHRIGRHVHPDARPETLPVERPEATGIDYLRLVADRHTAQLAERVRYAGLPADAALEAELASFADLHHALTDASSDTEQVPGQLDLTTLLDRHDDTDTCDHITDDETRELA